jgi:hypothetical protein
MPERARDQRPSRAIQAMIDSIRGGKVPIDPVAAPWHNPESGLPSFGYYNFYRERHEYGAGRIPKPLLWQYGPEGRERRKNEQAAIGGESTTPIP